MIPYTLLRSDRKTVSIEITRAGDVLVRVPRFASKKQIEAFVLEKQDWIEKHQRQVQERCRAYPEPTPEEANAMVAEAKRRLPPLVQLYGQHMGVFPAGITITGARTRFGSCSGKNRISFSWRLMAYPQQAIEYVVVHELAHLKIKNHSPGFYQLVAQYMPDYKEREKLLKYSPMPKDEEKGI